MTSNAIGKRPQEVPAGAAANVVKKTATINANVTTVLAPSMPANEMVGISGQVTMLQVADVILNISLDIIA